MVDKQQVLNDFHHLFKELQNRKSLSSVDDFWYNGLLWSEMSNKQRQQVIEELKL